MKYFVSYTTRDAEITRDLLFLFSKKLKDFGDVFIDIIDNNSTDKQARVIEELDCSDLIILVESKSTYESQWVALEISRAISQQIPIKVFSINEIERFSGF